MKNIGSLQKFYRESELRYQRRKLSIDSAELRKMIDSFYKEANENYLKLSKPTTCSREIYISVWINQEIGNDIARKGVGKPFSFDNPPPEYKAVSDFYINYPPQFIQETRKKRNEIWSQIDFKKIKEKWLAMVVERNSFSKNKDYSSRIIVNLNNFMISDSEYKKFLKNINKVVHFCNHQIFSIPLKLSEQESNNLCFVCRIEKFPFKDTSELLDFFEKKYPLLKKNKDKIKIKLANQSETKYIKEADYFEITLDEKASVNHKIMDLMHELSHVFCMLKSFERNNNPFKKGNYYREKSAIKVELDFIKRYFPELFSTELGKILQTIHQVLFEIEIYDNPNKDPDKLYAECFNRCFLGADQKINHGYFLNENILYNSFLWLPYAVAYVNVLQDDFLIGESERT